MDQLSRDVISLILDRIANYKDFRSFCCVCRRFAELMKQRQRSALQITSYIIEHDMGGPLARIDKVRLCLDDLGDYKPKITEVVERGFADLMTDGRLRFFVLSA